MSGTAIGKRIQDRFWNNVEPIPECGCLIWMRWTTKNGYGGCQFQGKKQGAHRVAWQLSYGLIPEGISVLHRCDTPSCVNPRHLFLGTQSDNIKDAFNKNRQTPPTFSGTGEKHPMAKLTKSQVLEIRSNKTDTQREIALRYGVSFGTISKIIKRQRWKHV